MKSSLNILMINGTMRKGSTYHIGKKLIELIAKEEDTITELFLPKDMPEFCRGCAVCITDSEKKCLDYLLYMKRITRLIDEADLLIFTTPVFSYHTTGGMKALLDHYGYRWMVHRPEASMFRKQAVCITTAAGGGMKSAIKDITDSLRYWGVAEIYTYGIAVGSTGWDGVDQKIKDKIELDVYNLGLKVERNTELVQPFLRIKLLFYIMRFMHKKLKSNKADEIYWEEKGWLGKKRPWKD